MLKKCKEVVTLHRKSITEKHLFEDIDIDEELPTDEICFSSNLTDFLDCAEHLLPRPWQEYAGGGLPNFEHILVFFFYI